MTHSLPVAITGASGFLGVHLVEAFLEDGTEVIAAVRNPARLAARIVHPRLVPRTADLEDVDALRRAFSGAHTVVANAALGSNMGPDHAYFATNVEGAKRTIQAAIEADVSHVIYVSTVAVYVPRLRRHLDEQAPRRQHAPAWLDPTRLTTDHRYSHTKTLAEEAVRSLAAQHGLQLTILRPGPIYGSRDDRFTARLLQSLRHSIRVVPSVGIPLVHARDVANVAVQARIRGLRAPLPNPAYNLAGPPVALDHVHRRLRAISGVGGSVLTLPVPVWAGFDTSRATADLSFQNRDLDDGLREVWMRHSSDR